MLIRCQEKLTGSTSIKKSASVNKVLLLSDHYIEEAYKEYSILSSSTEGTKKKIQAVKDC